MRSPSGSKACLVISSFTMISSRRLRAEHLKHFATSTPHRLSETTPRNDLVQQ